MQHCAEPIQVTELLSLILPIVVSIETFGNHMFSSIVLRIETIVNNPKLTNSKRLRQRIFHIPEPPCKVSNDYP